jgi:RimJ/RimL family protein N-acetyltransferase
MIPVLYTARLELRPLALEDAEQIQALFDDWEVVKYLNSVVPWPFPPDGAFTHIRDSALPAMNSGDEWNWTLRLKSEPGRIIGRISLYRNRENNRGFWIGRHWQGRGLMTEAVEVATAFWFDELGMPVLRAPKAVANIASRRISQRQGMRVVRVEEGSYVSGRMPAEVWEITAEEWRNRRPVSG